MQSAQITHLKPQDGVPYEILRDIFLLTLPERDCDRIHPSYPPTIISQVCSHWREIAFSEPKFWDTVIFNSIPRNYGHSNQRLADQHNRFIKSGTVQRWFHRTGGSHTLVLGEEASDKPSSCLIFLLFPIIVEFSGRIKALKIVMTSSSHLDYMRELTEVAQFGELARVEIHAVMRESMTSLDLEAVGVIHAFKDKTFKLKEAHFRVDMAPPLHFVMPWRQLRRVKLTGCPRRPVFPSDWMALLRLCPGLETAELINPYDPEGWPEAMSLSDVPKLDQDDELSLVSLTIHDADSILHHQRRTGSPECMFIHLLEFAHLKHLEIRVQNAPWTARSQQPERWLVQALSGLKSLESLTLYTSGRNDSFYPYRIHAIVQYWRATPPEGFGALRSFTLQYSHNHAPELVRLLQGPLSTTRCPYLSMTIAGEDEEMGMWGALLAHPSFSSVVDRLKVTPRSEFNFQQVE
ncbi:hypothetical protein DFP72DRAFT_893508 [Ephemerocybe angulata]|uniref:F-box domain-containing protein n=1 Tax=Ephemerocybe angulata TaxID=980116 RepID=A0A8H6I3H7_9AGAR|nr:hypothetical protein DFP72DRAFT_893508 [Tulosesus angulatus]